MSWQQHLSYRLALLRRTLRREKIPEKLLDPEESLIPMLASYFSLMALEKNGAPLLKLEGESFAEIPTTLEITFAVEERKPLLTKELERRLEYLEIDRSRPEIIIRETLEAIFPGVTFPTVRPNFLRYPPTGQNLEFDAYNETLRLAVEYNGIQHYVFTPAFHKTKEDLIAQQERDAFKLAKAKELNIDLLVIPYTVQDEDIPNMVRAWVSQLNRTPQEIAEAQRVSRCQEEKLSSRDIINLWSIVPDNITPQVYQDLKSRVEECLATPDEIITYEKIRWQHWFDQEATPELYLELHPYEKVARHWILWANNTNQEAYLLRQVLDLVKVLPGSQEIINSQDLLNIEDELTALYPSLAPFWPQLKPIQTTRYTKGQGGKVVKKAIPEEKKSYLPIKRFLDSLIGEYFGYHLEVIKRKKIEGKRVSLLQWQPNNPLLPLLIERMRDRGL